MRVLITGARGQVGHELMRLAPETFDVVGLSSTELDVADAHAVLEGVERVRPQLILNAAAYTAVDKAESDPERAFAVNRDGPLHLGRVAERLGIPVLHISTDYVYAGDAVTPYRETDPTGPAGVYGASKLAGEQALAGSCTRYIVLRTSWVFGAHGHNFVKTMLKLSGERDTLSVVADQQGCPTSAASIATALWRLAERYQQEGSLSWGVYHYAGTPACSWHEFAEEIFRQAYLTGLIASKPVVCAITSQQYPSPAKRPAWSVLDCSLLRQLYGIEPADWRNELKVVLTELKRGLPQAAL